MRLVLAATAVLLAITGTPLKAQDGRQLFNFFADQLGQEIERERHREQYRQEKRRYQVERREHDRLYQALLPDWHACHGGDLDACDRALASPALGDQDRTRLLNSRAALIARKHEEEARAIAAAREREQEEAERVRAEREAEERRVAELRAFASDHEACRRYAISSCDAALAFARATPEDRSQLLAWRSIAQTFDDNRTACQAGSVAACDTALASPTADAQSSALLREWRAEASPVNRTLAYVSEAGTAAATAITDVPAVTYAVMALAMLAAAVAYWRRKPVAGAPMPDSTPSPQPTLRPALELISTAYSQLSRQLHRTTVHALILRQQLVRMPGAAHTSHAEVPRDPITALAALELACAYMRDVQEGLGDIAGDLARQAQSLNDLSLASKQLGVAERADPTTTLTVEDDDGVRHELSLANLKAKALFLEGVCRAGTDPKRAIRILGQAVALEPTAAEAHYWIGLINAIHLRKGQAVAALKTAVALDPKNLAYRKELGRAENISGAQIAFDRAASGARTTTRAFKWAGLGIVGILLVAFIANVADPETRGPAILGLFAVLAMISMLVGMVKTIWNSVTGQG